MDWFQKAQRAREHLRIGRLLAAHTPPEKREEAIFEIVNQLNRGAPLMASQDEREQLSQLNLVAGKRAKASAAYAVALKYFVSGAALLPENAWESCSRARLRAGAPSRRMRVSVPAISRRPRRDSRSWPRMPRIWLMGLR